jgi:hypothetical protein
VSRWPLERDRGARPAKTIPTPIIDAPKASEPTAGIPATSRATTLPDAIATLTSSVPIMVAAAGRRDGPRSAARTSSARPVSSSVRVWRTTMNRLMTETAMNSHRPVSFITTAPTVGSSRP